MMRGSLRIVTGKGNEDRKEMPACVFSSSGGSGSEASCDRSQEDNGDYMLQRRSLDQSSTETGQEGNDTFTIVQLGRSEESRNISANPTIASQIMVGEKPANLVLPTPSLNIGMEYWSGSGAQSAVPSEQELMKPRCMQGALPATIANLTFSGPSSDGGPADLWLQDERELKRERRKQANRESARRSRMRKQAECEELAAKVESLSAENNSLKLEVNRLSDLSKKLLSENSSLLAQMQTVQGGWQGSTKFGNSKETGK